jgi:iron(III) transport system substrate-binding protein
VKFYEKIGAKQSASAQDSLALSQREREGVRVQSFVNKAATIILLVFNFAGAATAAEKAPWQAEWEKTVAAAKKEARLDLLTSPSPTYLEDFSKAFPEIKVSDLAMAGGSQARLKVLAERRAGKYLADVDVGGPDTPISILHPAKALDPIKPALLLPEVTDAAKWFERKHQYIDPEGQHIFLFEGSAQAYVAYNTDAVKPDEIRSYWDLLNPKWKGKIAAQDPRFPGTVSQAMRFFFYHPELGPKYLRRLLTETDLVISRDNRQMIDWVAGGKYVFCLFCRTTEVYQAMKQGLPFKLVGTYDLKEGASIVPITGAIGLFNRAPHPNAARLFINWFLSREGQTAYQKSKVGFGGADSLRVDIPKDDVPPEARRQPQGKYLMINRPEWFDMTPILSLVKEALGEAKQK